MTRPLVAIALTASAISVVCFLGAGAMFATTAASALPLGEIFSWDGNRPRCTNKLGDAGEQSATREFAWSGEEEVQLNLRGELRFRPGAENSVQVRGPAYLVGHLEIDGENIQYDCSPRRGTPRIDIEMTASDVSRYSVRGSGDIVLEDLHEDEVRISIAGSGSVVATGEVDELSLSIAGSGDADLGGLIAREIDISIAGSGDAIVSPVESIEISIAGSGDVEMLTNPANVETGIMGSGDITRRSATN